MATMADYLFERARQEGVKRDMLCFWGESSRGESWNWGSLWTQAARAGYGLRSRGVVQGSHVLMLVPEPDDAVACLFGIWAAGAVPVQLGLGSVGDLASVVAHIADVAKRVDAELVVISGAFAKYLPEDSGLPIATTTGILSSDGHLPRPVPGCGTAFIQLTSGTVTRSRGVVVTDDALTEQLESIGEVIPSGPGAVGVSWLPLYHDMGLVAGLLFPLVSGMRLHLASPLDFRRRPYAWLETLSAVKATHTVGPPAAYALAARLSQRAKADRLDLRSLSCALVSADRVVPRVMRECADKLADCGLRHVAFASAYGLAEATLAVTVHPPGEELRYDAVNPEELVKTGRAVPSTAEDAFEFTSAGVPIPGAKVKIVDDHDREQGERRVGHILATSSSLMAGYYNDHRKTAEAVQGSWLRTGDLGYLYDGHLFVTGRSKEIIISAGRNLFPSAIEETAAEVPGVRTGCVAAVGVPTDTRSTDLVVVVAETKAAPDCHDELRSEVKKALNTRDLLADCVVFTSPGSLPKTSSGKTRRTEVRRILVESSHPEIRLPERLQADFRGIPRKTDDTLVSIVIANYNYSSYIEDAIASCANQSHERLELLIGDDGSEDDSAAAIDRGLARQRDRFERTEAFFFEQNRGKIAVLNEILPAVRGDYVVILDSDDCLTVDYVARTLRVLRECRRRDPKVAFVYTDCLLVDVQGNFISRGVSRHFDAKAIESQSYIPECALVTARAMKQLLPMDEHVRRATKHHKWSKMVAQGRRGYYDPDPGFFYRMHDENLSGIGARVLRDLADGHERMSILTGYWPTHQVQSAG